jgi:cysteine desulfuration protein SufE
MSISADILPRAQKIVEEFSLFDDWMMRYEHLIDLGRSLPMIDPEFKTDEYLIRGCQSRVWLHASNIDGRIQLRADSDAMITRGLVAILLQVLNGQRPEDVVDADLSFLDDIGLKEHLSPTRKNGLDAMIRQIRLYAVALTAGKERS